MLNATLHASAASSSFTALLELPPTQVVRLLHDDEDTAPLIDSLQIGPDASNLEYKLDHLEIRKQVVVERKLPEKRKKVKKTIKEEEDKEEIEDEEEVGRGTGSRKRSKEESQSQLPYVHVRARRGQATDSHSLAERARREKINARMTLLKELVPGCSKISGIALVLDEIINHVQALQRQVEFLSMQLTTVNPRIEVNLDHFMYEENACVAGSFLSMHPPFEWSDPQVNGLIGFKQAFSQHIQCDPYQQSQWLKEENHSPTMPDTAHLQNNSSPSAGPRQLKAEQEL